MTGGSGLSRLRDLAAQSWQRGRANRLANPPPGQRFDPGLAIVTATVLATGALAGLTWASFEGWRGIFDAPMVQEVPDKRILQDFRGFDAPLVDAVRLGDTVVMGRQDGTLHSYDIPQELFTDDHLPLTPQLTGQLAGLSLGCGDRPAAGLPPCPVAGALFALTDRGGLARLQDGRWSVVLADEAWLDPDRQPVEQADILAWAASDDGRHVLALAGAKGMAQFDQRTAGWAIVPPVGAAPDRVVFSQGAFWLGSASGLTRVLPGTAPQAEAVPGADGAILDIDRVDGGVIVLRRGACLRGSGCLSILNVAGPGLLAGPSVSTLVGETEVDPSLSDNAIDHAGLQGGKIVVLGQAGVHVYDPALRHWQRLEPAAVDALLATADGQIMFAAGSRFAIVRDAQVASTRTLANPLVQIMTSGSGDILGFDRTGTVVNLSDNPPTTLTFTDPGRPDGATFAAGATLGDMVILSGPQGILLHNTRTRRYAFQPPSNLPAELADLARFDLVSSGQALWFVDKAQGRVLLAQIVGEAAAASVIVTPLVTPGQPFASAQGAGRELTVVTQDGAAHVILPDGKLAPRRLIGAALPRAIAPTAMAAVRDGLVFAADGALWRYDSPDRAWSGPFQLPEPAVRDLGLGRTLYALGAAGALYRSVDGAWADVAGAGPGAALSSRALTDATVAADRLYLAGKGVVQTYDPAARRFGDTWSAGNGAVRLVGIAANQLPVWTANARLLLGGDQVSSPDEQVQGAWAGSGEWVYLADLGRRRHAVSVDGAAGDCMFLGAAAPGGALVDARALPDGTVLALTDRGVGLHDGKHRRWVAVDEAAATAETRIDIIAGHLVRQDGTRLQAAALTALTPTPGCISSHGPLPWSQTLTPAAAVIDPAQDQVLLLGADGAIVRWQGATTTPVLPPVTAAPEMDRLLRAYADGPNLAFATTDAIWRYDLGQRVWRSSAFRNAPGNVTEVDLALTGAGPARVTLWTADGAAWGGTEQAGGVQFEPLTLPALPRITLPPDSIVDMAMWGGTLAILGRDGLQLVNTGDMQTRSTLTLPTVQSGWTLTRSPALTGFALVEGDIARPERLHVVPDDRVPERGDLADVAWSYAPANDRDWAIAEGGTLWRITPDLRLWRCAMGPGMAAPDGCLVAAEAPLPLTRADVRAALPFGVDATILLTGDRLLRLGADLRLTGAIEGPAIGAATRLFDHADGPLLWEGPGGALWRLDAAGASMVAGGVSGLQLQSLRILVETDQGLFQLQGATLNRPVLDAGPVLLAATLNGADILGLDDQGRVSRANGPVDQGDLVRLPPGTLSVIAGSVVLPDGRTLRGWWSQTAQGSARFDGTDLCPVPKPALPQSLGRDGLSRAERRFIADTPTPPPVPCIQSVETGLRLTAQDRLLSVTSDRTRVTAQTAHRRVILDPGTLAILSEDSLPPQDQPATPTGDRVRQAIAAVDGQFFLAPPRLDVTRPGSLTISGLASPVTAAGTRQFDPWPALDLPALAWDRASAGIRLGRSTGTPMPPGQAIVDQMLLPQHPGRAAFLGDGRFAWVNRFGLWQAQSGQTVEPVALAPIGPVEGLAHGVFLLAEGGIDPVTGATVPDTNQAVVNLGALTVTEDMRARQTAATLMVSGQPRPAYATQGFAFDRRLAVSRLGGQVVLLTPLGLIAADRLDGALAVPEGTDALGLDGNVLLTRQANGTWQVADGAGRWLPHAPPGHDAVLAVQDGVIWQRVLGRAGVVPADPTQGWRTAGRGLSFDMDQLVALAADGGGVVAITGVGTETARTLGALGATTGPVAPDPGTDALDAQAVRPGQSVLWAKTGAGPQVWDQGARNWRTPDPDAQPWAARLAAQAAGLEIAFFDGTPQATVAVTGLDREVRQTPFDWATGDHLPFDTIRALHVEAGHLLLGTDFGLRVLVEAGDALIAGPLHATRDASPGQVTAVGRPTSAPDTILAAAGRDCLQLANPSAPPQTCDNAAALSDRMVQDNSLWRWTKGDGAVAGAYHLSDGSDLAIPNALRGRLPHDTLADRSSCADTVAEVWEEAAVVATLNAGVPTRLDPVEPSARLLCQRDLAELGQQAQMQPGLYAVGRGAALLVPSGWQPVGPAQTEGAIARAAGEIVSDLPRLRLRLTAGEVTAQLRRLNDTWQDIGWRDGRIALDVVGGLARGPSGLHVITPAGLVAVRSPASLTLDPDTVTVATPADPVALGGCALDRIEIRDGTEQSVPAEPNAPAVLRCLDGRVFAADLTGRQDIGALTPVAADPFVNRVLVDQPDLWTWTRTDSTAGQRGAMAITFKGEPLALSGGRLTVDDYRGLAVALPGAVDVVTANGWWRQQDGQMALPAAASPKGVPGAGDVVRLWSDQTDAGAVLCLDGADGARTMDATGLLRSVAACHDFVGADPIWVWRQGGAGPLANGTAANGVAMSRQLQDGRFADLIVTGAPSALADGSIAAPTRAGAIVLGDAGPQALFASDDRGVLMRGVAGVPILITPAGLLPLGPADDPACGGVQVALQNLPPDHALRRVEMTGPDQAVLWADIAGERQQMLIPCATPDRTLVWADATNVADRDRFRAYSNSFATPNSTLITQVRDGQMDFRLAPDVGLSSPVPILDPPIALIAAQDGRASLLVTTADVYRTDTDHVLRQLALSPEPLPPVQGLVTPVAAEPTPPPIEEAALPVSPSAPPPAEPEPEAVAEPMAEPSSEPEMIMSPAEIMATQTALAKLGYRLGRADGILGKRSSQAISDWQKTNGHAQTGKLTQGQYDTLLGAAGQ